MDRREIGAIYQVDLDGRKYGYLHERISGVIMIKLFTVLRSSRDQHI